MHYRCQNPNSSQRCRRITMSSQCCPFGSSYQLALVGGLAILAVASIVRAEDDRPLVRSKTLQWKGKAGTLDHLYADASTSRLFVANQSNDTLDVIDLKTNRLLHQIPDQKTAHSVVYVPSLDRIFVSSGA